MTDWLTALIGLAIWPGLPVALGYALERWL